MQKRQLINIQKQINSIKRELQKVGEMRPGSLSRQFVSQYGKKYPYYQISYTHNTKSHTDYIRKEFIAGLRQEIKNYKRFKYLVKRWVDLAMEYSKLKVDIASKKM